MTNNNIYYSILYYFLFPSLSLTLWSRLTENGISYTYAYLLDPNAPNLCTNPISSIKSIDTTNSSAMLTTSSTTFTFKPISKVNNSTSLETGIKRCKSQGNQSSVFRIHRFEEITDFSHNSFLNDTFMYAVI